MPVARKNFSGRGSFSVPKILKFQKAIGKKHFFALSPPQIFSFPNFMEGGGGGPQSIII